MAEEHIRYWDGGGDPEQAGWYITLEFDGRTDAAIGPYDTEEEARAIMAKHPREEPP
jgi:hypothetical protein